MQSNQKTAMIETIRAMGISPKLDEKNTAALHAKLDADYKRYNHTGKKACDAKGITPIHAAIEYANPAALAWLLKNGADVFIPYNANDESKTASSTTPICKAVQYEDMARYNHEKSTSDIDVKNTDQDEKQLLLLNNRRECFKLLMMHKAPPPPTSWFTFTTSSEDAKNKYAQEQKEKNNVNNSFEHAINYNNLYYLEYLADTAREHYVHNSSHGFHALQKSFTNAITIEHNYSKAEHILDTFITVHTALGWAGTYLQQECLQTAIADGQSKIVSKLLDTKAVSAWHKGSSYANNTTTSGVAHLLMPVALGLYNENPTEERETIIKKLKLNANNGSIIAEINGTCMHYGYTTTLAWMNSPEKNGDIFPGFLVHPQSSAYLDFAFKNGKHDSVINFFLSLGIFDKYLSETEDEKSEVLRAQENFKDWYDLKSRSMLNNFPFPLLANAFECNISLANIKSMLLSAAKANILTTARVRHLANTSRTCLNLDTKNYINAVKCLFEDDNLLLGSSIAAFKAEDSKDFTALAEIITSFKSSNDQKRAEEQKRIDDYNKGLQTRAIEFKNNIQPASTSLSTTLSQPLTAVVMTPAPSAPPIDVKSLPIPSAPEVENKAPAAPGGPEAVNAVAATSVKTETSAPASTPLKNALVSTAKANDAPEVENKAPAAPGGPSAAKTAIPSVNSAAAKLTVVMVNAAPTAATSSRTAAPKTKSTPALTTGTDQKPNSTKFTAQPLQCRLMSPMDNASNPKSTSDAFTLLAALPGLMTTNDLFNQVEGAPPGSVSLPASTTDQKFTSLITDADEDLMHEIDTPEGTPNLTSINPASVNAIDQKSNVSNANDELEKISKFKDALFSTKDPKNILIEADDRLRDALMIGMFHKLCPYLKHPTLGSHVADILINFCKAKPQPTQNLKM